MLATVLISRMPKAKGDEAREQRIQLDIVADAHDGEERALGWYCYLEDTLRFPFRAKCMAKRSISPLRQGQTVEAVELAAGDECGAEIFVTVKWEDQTLAVPLMQLQPTGADEATLQAVEDWHYWVRQGYEFAD